MGNGIISRKPTDGDEIIKLVMPSYYISDPNITELDVDNVQASWCMILSQNGMQYIKMKEVQRINQDQSCLTWFYNIFFHRVRLLSIRYPAEVSSNSFSNSKFLIAIIRCVLCVHAQDSKFQVSSQRLFASMDALHITFCDMCMIGGVLFTSLQECLGVEFTAEVKNSWVKLYSALLRDMAKATSNGRTSDVSSELTSTGKRKFNYSSTRSASLI